ncbi:MAG: ATP-binding protein [DPANN group archaeon]|nr:ATP-binding protein [DPANN group archaeon]
MRKEVLEEFNEWWFTRRVPPELLETYKRHLLQEVLSQLGKRQIISIIGLRRVGKTVMMRQTINHLLTTGVDAKQVLYFSFDETVKDLNDILTSYKELQGVDFRHDKTYLFLDEIQKLENWQNQLKKYYDLYPKMKFVLSGSEGLFIAQKTKETLAGRIYEHYLPSLSFKEFLELRNKNINLPQAKIKQELVEYILRGGFPEVINEDARQTKEYIRSIVIDKIIYKDFLQLFHIRDLDKLKKIMEAIAINPGMDVSYQSIAQQFDLNRKTVSEYVMILEEGFVVKLLGNYRKGGVSTLRKTKRAYLTDTGIISAYKPIIDDSFFGRMVETAVINALGTNMFWKNSYDVDAVINKTPVEVKYQHNIVSDDLKGTKEFMKKFKTKKGIIITKDTENEIKTEHGKIHLIPAWKFMLHGLK